MRKHIDLAVWVIAFIMLLMVFGFTYLGYKGGYPHRYAYEAFSVDLILLIALIYGLYIIVKPSGAR